MEGDMPATLDFVLEQIFRNGFIEDRRTLLTARQVCRTWRTLSLLSDQITAATLYTLADVRLAVGFFPRSPCQRPPWRSVEESTVFPSLKTLRVSEALLNELYTCSTTRALLASIDQMDVHMTIDGWNSEHASYFRTVSGIASAIQITVNHEYTLLNTFCNPTALARLTRLTFCGGSNVHNFEPLRALSGLSSLQHLQLLGFPKYADSNLSSCFSICARLTQLTRLDISCRDMAHVNIDLDGIRYLVNHEAPKSLINFDLWLGPGRGDWGNACRLHTSIQQGSEMVNQCIYHERVRTPEELNLDGKLYQKLAEALKYGAPSQHLEVHIFCKAPKAKFLLDVTTVASLRELSLVFKYRGYIPPNQDAYDSDQQSPSALVTNSSRPVLVIQPGLQTAATRLEFDGHHLGAMGFTSIAHDLPALFPQLKHLTLRTVSSGLAEPDYLHQLTKLTHLTLDVELMDSASLPELTPYFPASLRELEIRVQDLDIPSFANLVHLTKLTLCRQGLTDQPSLDALYSCQVPLRDLCLQGFQLQTNLPALVRACPCLEILELALDSFDVSPLSSLGALHKLTVHLPDSDLAFVTGAEKLTSLAYLIVQNASESLDGLSDLAQLTRLRHLEYFIENAPVRNPISTFRHLLKQLRLSMPHSRVAIYVASNEI